MAEEQSKPNPSGNSLDKPRTQNPIQQAPQLIKLKLGDVTADDLKAYQEVSSIEDKRYKMEQVLKIWGKQQEEERILRKFYGKGILWFLFLELIVGNVAFILLGLHLINVTQWIAETFFTGMYGQIVAITLIVVKNLFPPAKEDSSTQLNQMVDKL